MMMKKRERKCMKCSLAYLYSNSIKYYKKILIHKNIISIINNNGFDYYQASNKVMKKYDDK